jgi:hypothetical protein
MAHPHALTLTALIPMRCHGWALNRHKPMPPPQSMAGIDIILGVFPTSLVIPDKHLPVRLDALEALSIPC